MYPLAEPAFAATTLGTSYAAEASERLCIYPGRTCGFAAEISVGLNDPEVRRASAIVIIVLAILAFLAWYIVPAFD